MVCKYCGQEIPDNSRLPVAGNNEENCKHSQDTKMSRDPREIVKWKRFVMWSTSIIIILSAVNLCLLIFNLGGNVEEQQKKFWPFTSASTISDYDANELYVFVQFVLPIAYIIARVFVKNPDPAAKNPYTEYTYIG